jgi:hypothetical protein
MTCLRAAVLPLAPTRRGQRGQSALEFSLVIPIFLGLLMAIFEGARLATSFFALSNAAREGGRAAVYRPTASLPAPTIDANIRARARGMLPAWISIPDADVVICRHVSASAAVTDACDTAGFKRGSVVDVTVRWRLDFWFFPGNWLRQTSKPLSGYHRAQLE